MVKHFNTRVAKYITEQLKNFEYLNDVLGSQTIGQKVYSQKRYNSKYKFKFLIIKLVQYCNDMKPFILLAQKQPSIKDNVIVQ